MFKKQITIRIDGKMYKQPEKKAKEQLRSVSGLIRLILTKDLEESHYNEWTKSN